MTTNYAAGARCSFSRKTLLAVAAVSAAGAAVVVAAYAKGRKKRNTAAGTSCNLHSLEFVNLVMFFQSKPSEFI